jgi:poly-gamma-glutamate system protein
MPYSPSYVSRRTLVALAILSSGMLYLALNSKVLVTARGYDEKRQAARLTQIMHETVRRFLLDRAATIDLVNDPNSTGLIGNEYTLITTDRGVLRAKLTATNPNFSAVFVDMLMEARLAPGDVVAVAFTGSFPSLNMAALAAMETMRLEPIIITSVGASSFGANDPSFTWLDMETMLAGQGLIRHRSVAASMGGGEDVGRGLSPRGRDLILAAIRRTGVTLINEETLEESIRRRVAIYDQHAGPRPFRLAMNVGGGVAALGSSITAKLIPEGLTVDLGARNFPARGAILLLAERGVPVIHMRGVVGLAERYGLPVAPIPLPEVGEGEVFISEKLNVTVAALLCALLVILLVILVRIDLAHRLLPQRKEEG